MILLKDVLTDMAKAIVESPDSVSVTETESAEGEVVLTLSVAPDDMGKVIGKQGKIAKAMRTIVRSATPASSKRYVIEIRERGGDAVNVDEE